MAFASVLALAALLLLQPLSARSHDSLSPLLAPFLDPCIDVDCGEGTCKPDPKNSSFPYECDCYPGWKHTPGANDRRIDKVLPCYIPSSSSILQGSSSLWLVVLIMFMAKMLLQ